MIYQETDLPKFVKYWNEDFQTVLLWYYTEWCDKGGPIRNVILSAKHNSFSDIRPKLCDILPIIVKSLGNDVDGAECDISHNNLKRICPDEYFFSASMYYISSIPQIICKIVSPKAARYFLNSSGWPAISLGLGGFMSPEQILFESGLLPYPNEVNKYISLLKIVHPFQKRELLEYMSGRAENICQKEYALFCEEIKGSEEQIIEELDKCLTSFISICAELKNGKERPWPMMYLDNNCSFYEE